MDQQTRQRQWLDAGKQIGKVYSYRKDNVLYWSSVGIQKWENEFVLYVSDIEEEQMSMAEEYLLEKVAKTRHFEDLTFLLASRTTVKLEELTPLRGQRVFNPKFH